MQRPQLILTGTVGAFAVHYALDEWAFRSLYDAALGSVGPVLAYWLAYVVVGVPVFAAVLYLHKPTSALEALGLRRAFGLGLAVAFVFTLPMLLGYASIFTFSSEVTATKILKYAVGSAFF